MSVCFLSPPPLAALMSCFFDRRSETDSMICTPAQTCMATSIPMVWLENVRVGISMPVCFTISGLTGEQTLVTLIAAISSDMAAIVLCIHTREIKEMKALFLYFCFF